MTWGVATALLEQRGSEGLFEVDEAWLPRVAAAARPVADRARQPLPRPARPLRRDGDAGRRVGGDWSTRRAGRTALRPQRRRPADRRPRARPRGRRREPASSTSASTTPPRRCPSCSTPPTPSTAAAAATPTPTSAPSSATSATTPARTAAPAGRDPDVAATAIELRRDGRLDASPCAPPPASCGWSCRCPASTTSTTRSRRSPPALELGVEPERIGAALADVRAAFGRVETIAVGGQAGLDPADQEPGRRQRGPAHAAPGGRRRAGSTSGSRSTTGSPTAATSPGSGTPTSSCWPGPVRRVVCAGTRAPEMALRLKYAGWPEDADRGRAARSTRSLDRAVAEAPEAALRAAHLHRAARAAQAAWTGLAKESRRAESRRPDEEPSSGTTSSAAPTRPTWRSGRAWRTAAGGPILDLGCGTGRVALAPRRGAGTG